MQCQFLHRVLEPVLEQSAKDFFVGDARTGDLIAPVHCFEPDFSIQHRRTHFIVGEAKVPWI